MIVLRSYSISLHQLEFYDRTTNMFDTYYLLIFLHINIGHLFKKKSYNE